MPSAGRSRGTEKLRVLFLHSSPVWNAIAATHADLMRGFDPTEVEVHVACTPRPSVTGGRSALERLSAIPHIRVHPTDFGVSFMNAREGAKRELLATAPRVPINVASLARAILRHRIDLLHYPSKQRDVLYGLLLGALTRRKSINQMHFKFGQWMATPLKWALHRSDAVVAVSRFASQSIISEGSVPAERVSWVHNSINMEEWPARGNGEAVRAELGIPPRAPLIGIVGRLIEWKGHRELIEAFAGLSAQVHDAHLLVVGAEAPHAHGRTGFKQELTELAQAAGVGKRVIFVSYRRDIARLLGALDIFAFPSWEEGFGLALLEAMAVGLPVVAWDNGGPRELVEHERTGLMVEPKNVGALKASLLRLLKDPRLRDHLGAGARERARTAFSPRAAAQRMVSIYRRVLAEESLEPLG